MKQDIFPDKVPDRPSEVMGVQSVVLPSPKLKTLPVPVTTRKPAHVATPSPTVVPTSSPKPLVINNDLNNAVNVWRKARGQSALEADGNVCKAASERVLEIAKDFSHDKFLDAVNRNGIDYKSVSENIAMNTRMSVSAAVDQWDKSPHHHEAMIGDFNFGCGVIIGNYAEFILLKK